VSGGAERTEAEIKSNQIKSKQQSKREKRAYWSGNNRLPFEVIVVEWSSRDTGHVTRFSCLLHLLKILR